MMGSDGGMQGERNAMGGERERVGLIRFVLS